MHRENKTRFALVSSGVDYIPLDLPVITKKDLQREPVKPPKPREILPRGVHWHKRDKKYIARPQCNCKIYRLGTFYTVEEAGKAIQEFRKTHPLPSPVLTKGNARPQKGGASKYKGVVKNQGYWHAKQNKKSLGCFPFTKKGEKQAALAYDKVAEEQWGKDVKHNQYWFPEDFK